jgi:hypothetical protein
MKILASIAVFVPVSTCFIRVVGPDVGLQMILEGKESIAEEDQKVYTYSERIFYGPLIFMTEVLDISSAWSLDENWQISDAALNHE